MIPYIDYYNAKKSLAMAKETIKMMNDPDNYMLEAQKDMRELEVAYYRGQSIKFTAGLLITVVIGVIMYILFRYGVLNV